MKLIVGIGNTGAKYDMTRHNIGFDVVDRIAETAKARWADRPSLRSKVAEAGEDVLLVKPQDFVNNTGIAAERLEKEFHPKSDEWLFICDDVNLVFGKMRFRSEGSAGGHHGLESVIAALGHDGFPRLRLGVANDTMPKGDLSDFVLARFDVQERKAVPDVVKNAAQVCRVWMLEGAERAMDELGRLQSVKSKQE